MGKSGDLPRPIRMTKSSLFVVPALLLLTAGACQTKQSKSETTQTTEQPATVSAPAFNADSAYAYVDQQVKFGPRVPNTPAHVRTADYLAAKLRQFGCDVTVQSFVATTWDGKKINARNIIGEHRIRRLRKRVFIVLPLGFAPDCRQRQCD